MALKTYWKRSGLRPYSRNKAALTVCSSNVATIYEVVPCHRSCSVFATQYATFAQNSKDLSLRISSNIISLLVDIFSPCIKQEMHITAHLISYTISLLVESSPFPCTDPMYICAQLPYRWSTPPIRPCQPDPGAFHGGLNGTAARPIFFGRGRLLGLRGGGALVIPRRRSLTEKRLFEVLGRGSREGRQLAGDSAAPRRALRHQQRDVLGWQLQFLRRKRVPTLCGRLSQRLG